MAKCIYCKNRADSNEHIVATRFIALLAQDPRGLRLPIRLYVPLADGSKRTITGKKNRRGKHTLEYITRVCEDCNNTWMNQVDDRAWPFVSEMIQDHAVTLDAVAAEAVALWFMKVAVTARSAPFPRMDIDEAWTDWLHTNQSPIPNWYVWVGRYVGSAPWRYKPHDVRVEQGPGSGPLPPGVGADHGVYATMAIGYLVVQVFGAGPNGAIVGPTEPLLPQIWPWSNINDVTWPPPVHVDDIGLPLLEDRLLDKDTEAAPTQGPNRAVRRAKERTK
jgi:hypothetical protein